jgi:hypothetical protein
MKVIVKVQLPEITALVTDRDGRIQKLMPVNEQTLLMMAGARKRYFYARVIGTDLVIDEEAPDQNW